MTKALTLMGMIVAVLLLALFGLDLVAGIPFQGASKIMDIGFVICALLLFVMSWMTKKEQG